MAPSMVTMFEFGNVMAADQYKELQKQLAAAEKSAAQASCDLARLQVDHDCLQADRDQLKTKNDDLEAKFTKMNGTNDLYTTVTELQEREGQLEADLDKERKQNKTLQQQSADKDVEILSKDNQISTLTTANANLKASLDDIKQELEDQQKATSESDSHLDKAYADAKREREGRQSAVKAKDEAEARLKEAHLELQGIHIQWEQAQDTIQDLESQTTHIQDLERETDTLHDDIDQLRKQVDDLDRANTVKNARIQNLETQYQKALEGKLNAEAAVTAAAEPTAVSQIYTTGEDSLADELAAADDFGDTISEYQQLEYSEIAETANITPGEAPKLSLADVKATSVIPITLQTVASSTQTDAPKLPETSEIATQTVAPKPIYSIVQSTLADITPVELMDWPLQPQPVKLPTTGPSVTTQTIPIVEQQIASTAVPVSDASLKRSAFPFSYITIACLLLLCFMLSAQLHAWKIANSYGHNSRYSYSHGAFGNGRYLFGFIPLGFDIGHSWFSEEVCRQTSTVIAAFEDWAGITPTPLF